MYRRRKARWSKRGLQSSTHRFFFGCPIRSSIAGTFRSATLAPTANSMLFHRGYYFGMCIVSVEDETARNRVRSTPKLPASCHLQRYIFFRRSTQINPFLSLPRSRNNLWNLTSALEPTRLSSSYVCLFHSAGGCVLLSRYLQKLANKVSRSRLVILSRPGTTTVSNQVGLHIL